jgi:hypothetical protein
MPTIVSVPRFKTRCPLWSKSCTLVTIASGYIRRRKNLQVLSMPKPSPMHPSA